MQSLTWEEIKNLKGESQEKREEYRIPEGYEGVDVSVYDGKESVDLTVQGRAVSLSIQGARDLAMALRQSANRVEKLRR